ncbi:MAG: hypothetical protein Q4C91_16920 [Eubacteriales bacterium]|nr:hypothetical protein [Eubacteriales bacterium]
MKDEMMRREIQEAVEAGERALRSLRLAKERLDSARSWGIFDMLGGGFFSDMMKHSRMNDAASYMEDAKRDLQKFQRELRDVHVPTELRMEVSGFLTFADFFFDGFIADYMVQSRIADAREQVNSAISRVESLLMDLEQMNR